MNNILFAGNTKSYQMNQNYVCISEKSFMVMNINHFGCTKSGFPKSASRLHHRPSHLHRIFIF